MKYVHFTRDQWIVRVTVPLELREIVGLRELKEPLGGDKRAAERAAHGIIAGFLAQIEEARAHLESSKPTMSTVAKAHYRLELEADDRARAAGAADIISLNAFSAPRRATLLRLVASGQLVGEQAEALVGYGIDAMIEAGIVKADHVQALDRGELLRSLAEAQLDAMNRFAERDQGIMIAGQATSPLLTQPDPEPAAPALQERGTGTTLDAILVAFHGERTAGNRTLAEKTMTEHEVAVRMLEEFLGKGIPARSITRADMLRYKAALLQTPSRYSLRFRGLTLPQAIKANLKRETPFSTLDPQTINMKWLSHLSTIFKWSMNNGYLDTNPATGVRVDEGNGYKEPSRVPFTQADLNAIFGDFYRSTPSEKWETRHWALLLALYTGARSSSEIARVRLDEIFQEQGVDVINLALASKNTRSKRLVPIHKHLVDLGFLDHVERLRKKKGATRLFADWEPEDKVNRWFLRNYRKKLGISDTRKVFHSFRNTLKTKLASYGVNRDVSDLITGHKDQSVAAVYIGDAATTMIKAMSEALDRVDFKLPVAA